MMTSKQGFVWDGRDPSASRPAPCQLTVLCCYVSIIHAHHFRRELWLSRRRVGVRAQD